MNYKNLIYFKNMSGFYQLARAKWVAVTPCFYYFFNGEFANMILKNQQGLTLIELMMAIAILVLLIAVAYPMYSEQVRKTRRSDAKTSLAELAQLQEERFVDQKSYATDLDQLLGSGYKLGFEKDGTSYLSKEKHYRLFNFPGENGSSSAFTLQATAINAQASDENCARFILRSTGEKGAFNAQGASNDNCW